MKSKIFVFITLILVGILFGITSCQDLNNSNSATVTFNLDLSKIVKNSRNETSQNSEYILKIFAYNAFSYRNGSEIENLPLITKIENKVNANGIVKVTMNIEVGVNVIFGAKLYEVVNNKISENPTYIGHSDIVKIKAVDNNVNLVFTKNEVHQHTFATEWSSDVTHHWHAATCEHTTEVSDKAKHTFEWEITQNPTETEKGEKTGTCTVCGYKATEVLAKLNHTHTFAEDWTSDETHHWHAVTCEHSTELGEKSEHTFSGWQVIKEASCTEEGEKKAICTVCGYEKTEITYKTEHSFTSGICVCGMREMVLIPAGTFQMGSNDSISTAKPVQDVTITKSFYMGKFEVTQAEYEKYCSYTGSGSPSTRGDGDNYPAYWVNWYDALVYCNKRSITEGLTPCYSISGKTDPSTWGNVPSLNDTNWKIVVCDWEANGYRLPTEAEWEYAARAGDNTISTYTWSGTSNVDELVDYAWFIDNSIDKIHEVGTKKANSLGLYDMSGNVEEWCWNWYTSSYTAGTEGGSDPTGASSGTYRVTRGGCWRSYAGDIFVNDRNYNEALNHVETCGFRVVRLAEVHEHTFSGWQVTKEASCTENGERKATCIVCGYEKTEITDKTEHSFAYGICVCGLPEGFVLVEAGTFQLGSELGYDDNKPVHQVTITKSFYMGKYEVTQAEYEKYCRYGSDSPGSSKGNGDNYPAYYVSWYDALVYCNKRSIAERLISCYSIKGSTDPDDWGTVPTSSNSTWDAAICNFEANGYRLPTEAEWEYAARAGENTVDSLTYSGTSDINELEKYAWYSDNSNSTTHEVGTKKANAFGLYDMSGNLFEWCWNWKTSSYDTGKEGGSDPTGASAGSLRVVRGGSWGSSDRCAVSSRYYGNPSYRRNFYGFRVVRSATTE